MLLLVRKDLGMGQGKIAAQCGHAAMGIVANYLLPYHELLLVDKNRVNNPWDEDVKVFYQPTMGSDDDDEDEDEDDDEDEQNQPSKTNLTVTSEPTGPRTILEALQAAKKADETVHQEPPATTTTTEASTPTTCPATTISSTELTLPPNCACPSETPKSPLIDCTSCGKRPKPDPKDPTTMYLYLTPRQIRQKLFNIDVPIELLMKHIIAKWVWRGQAKIALKINSDSEMSDILNQLRNAGVPFYEIYDAGLTQIAANTRTVVAVGPFPADILDPVLGHLKLL